MTYTYTARSQADRADVLTFTLQNDDTLHVDLGAPLERVRGAVQGGQNVKDAIVPLIKPTAVSLSQQGLHTFQLGDVDVEYVEEGDLLVRLWVRRGGLRIAPVDFRVTEVDNPDAARSFVAKLDERKTALAHPGAIEGPYDYWASWLLTGVAVILIAVILRRIAGNRA